MEACTQVTVKTGKKINGVCIFREQADALRNIIRDYFTYLHACRTYHEQAVSSPPFFFFIASVIQAETKWKNESI